MPSPRVQALLVLLGPGVRPCGAGTQGVSPASEPFLSYTLYHNYMNDEHA